jgi:2-amino-4-hydroxy-6-hydroxymethyldihydropteridine diphosphokinase
MSDTAVVYVAIGSNVDPMANVPAALELLASQANLTGLSRFYRTAAISERPQDDFVNGVVRLETERAPLPFKFEILRPIEARLGRERGEDKFAPRTLDLDILLFDDVQANGPDLELPAPELFERPFLVQCLLEVAPDISIPGLERPATRQGELLEEFTRALQARWLP